MRIRGTPSCETVTVWLATPTPVTVICATRGVIDVFSLKVAKIVSFPVPEGVTVHHAEPLVTVQLTLDVTMNFVIPEGVPTFWFGGVTVSVGKVVTKFNVSPIYVPDIVVPTRRKKYWVPAVKPVRLALTGTGVDPEPADRVVVVSPKLVVVPQSK